MRKLVETRCKEVLNHAKRYHIRPDNAGSYINDIEWNINLIADDILQELLRTVIELYYATGNKDFFILHGVTSSHGVKYLYRTLTDKNDR
jgi:hypothetical protein